MKAIITAAILALGIPLAVAQELPHRKPVLGPIPPCNTSPKTGDPEPPGKGHCCFDGQTVSCN